MTYLDLSGSHIGHKESVRYTARALARIYDGIEYHGFAHATVEALAEAAGVPVWNGLTDEWHPSQALGDKLTMTEHAGKSGAEISFAYLGDSRDNAANSLLGAAPCWAWTSAWSDLPSAFHDRATEVGEALWQRTGMSELDLAAD